MNKQPLRIKSPKKAIAHRRSVIGAMSEARQKIARSEKAVEAILNDADPHATLCIVRRELIEAADAVAVLITSEEDWRDIAGVKPGFGARPQ